MDVDLVINTHLHGDHCGGNTQLGEHGTLTSSTPVVATFPRATYCVQRLELADASFPTRGPAAPTLTRTLSRWNKRPVRVLWGIPSNRRRCA